MDTPDLGNAFFQFGSALFVMNHCRVLLKDKMVRGVSALSTAFFACYGAYNIYYFNHLQQEWSWWAGLSVFFTNIVWLLMMIYYKNYPGGRITRHSILHPPAHAVSRGKRSII